MNEARFAIRLIRKGRVKVGRVWFRPTSQYRVYKGELDGMRFAFGRYRQGDGYAPFIALWGTEEQYRSHKPELQLPEPHCIDGYYVWYNWEAEAPDAP